MKTLSKVKSGWKWLETIHNLLVDAVNQRTVVAGAGIEVNEGTNGVMISLAGTSTKDKAAAASSAAGGAWLTIDVMDASCNRSTIQVWAKTS